MIKSVINSFLSLWLFLQTLNAEEVTISTSINLDEYQNQQSSFCRPQSNKQNLEWYENFETNRKSPTKRLGFIDPEGIVKGSKAKLLKNTAINIANIKVLNTSIIFSFDSK